MKIQGPPAVLYIQAPTGFSIRVATQGGIGPWTFSTQTEISGLTRPDVRSKVPGSTFNTLVDPL